MEYKGKNCNRESDNLLGQVEKNKLGMYNCYGSIGNGVSSLNNYTKLARLWPIRMNVLVQAKLYYLSKWNDGKLSKNGIFDIQHLNFKYFSQKYILKRNPI